MISGQMAWIRKSFIWASRARRRSAAVHRAVTDYAWQSTIFMLKYIDDKP
jgi:hypothetical protein